MIMRYKKLTITIQESDKITEWNNYTPVFSQAKHIRKQKTNFNTRVEETDLSN